VQLATEEHVPRRRQVIAQGEVLIDDLDALPAGLDRLVEVDGFVGKDHLAARRREVAGNDLDEGGLASPVVPHEPKHLAGLQFEVHLAESPDRTEILGYVLE
jgi:hypothetical protein